jgi:hypothetical protein
VSMWKRSLNEGKAVELDGTECLCISKFEVEEVIKRGFLVVERAC